MEELNGSELGTLEFWKEAYKREIKNFEHNGDFGEVWFGEDSVERVTKWFEKSNISKDVKIIDVGCGNGYSLIQLAQEGFTNLFGIDYSAEAIELAEKIAQKNFPQIKFMHFDILSNDLSILQPPFGLVHDKGTYDAISLHPEHSASMRKAYMQKLAEIMDTKSIFLITSCNWTQSELVDHFENFFQLQSVIPTPQFRFGGSVGSVVTSLVFAKK